METNEDIIRKWLAKAAEAVHEVTVERSEHSEQVSQKLINSLNVTQVKLDELWSFVKKKSAQDETEAYNQKRK